MENIIKEVAGRIRETRLILEITEEEMAAFYDYVQNINTCYYYDETVYNILWEEMQMVLAGDQTPEEAAKMIQIRASIYLSEQS